MTKKDFAAVAAALKGSVDMFSDNNLLPGGYGERGREEGFRSGTLRAVEAVASVFANNNPRFDRARFYEACGLVLAANGFHAKVKS